MLEVLNDGPARVETVLKEAEMAGIEKPTLRRARESIGVKAVRHNDGCKRGEGYWTWELVQDGQPPSLDNGHLEDQLGDTPLAVAEKTGVDVQGDHGEHAEDDGYLELPRKRVVL